MTLITITVVLLLAFASTTAIKAVDINEYPYILYDDGTGTIIISDMELQYAQIGESGWNPVTAKIGTWINTPIDDVGMADNDNNDYYWGVSRAKANGYTLVPQMVDGVIVYDVNPNWYGIISSNGNVSKSIFIIEPQYTFPTGELYGNYNPTGWGQVPDLPDNIAGKTVEEIIAEQTELTRIGEHAQQIQEITVNIIQDYNAGYVDKNTLERQLEANEAELDMLNNTAGASIGDLIAINNAITQNQTAQQILNRDEIIQKLEEENTELKSTITDHNTVNNTLRNYINNQLTNAEMYYNMWQQDTAEQDNVVNNIRITINRLKTAITNTSYQSVADQQAITNAIDYCNSLIDTIYKSHDLDKTVSNEAQTSISEENEYFEELLAETSSSIAEMSPSNEITDEEMNVALEIVNGVWDNPIIKKILPLTCCFLVICVALGIKYRL